MQRLQTNTEACQKTFLYRTVFDGVFVKYVIVCMGVFFLIHPVIPVFASEEADSLSDIAEEVSVQPEVEEVVADVEPEPPVVESENASTDVVEEEEVVSTEEVQESESLEEALVSEEVVDSSEFAEIKNPTPTPTKKASVNKPVVTEDSSTTSVVPLSDQGQATVLGSGTSTSNTAQSTSTPDTTVAPTSTPTTTQAPVPDTGTTATSSSDTEEQTQNEDVVATSTPDIANTDEPTEPELEVSITPVATTTVPVKATTTIKNATSTHAVSYVRNNLNAHQFSNTECVSVGDGAFYCSEQENAPEFVKDGVYAAQDADGDMEIFVSLQGESVQISHNTADDGSPYYDALSKRAVWHTLLHDRYQIVSYDFQTQETIHLTDATYNNMEPVAYGDITLWQAWIGTNWEIMKYENGTTTQLTDNTMHDVAPHMRGGHMLWQTQFADAWKVAVYDIETGTIEYIATNAGSRAENPRMVLVYESTDEHGDVQTLGYDFDSQSSFLLGTLPNELPERLPEPDQTGETRALVQSKTNGREVDIIETQPVPTGTGTGTGTGTSTSTSTASTSPGVTVQEPLTLDLSTSTQQVADTLDTVSPSTTIQTLVITATTTDTSINTQQIPAIEDVVIPPQTGSSTEEIG